MSRTRMPRRAFPLLVVSLVAGLASLSPSCGSDGRGGGTAVTVVVLVIDSLMPDEVDSMPTLAALRDQGTSYPESRAVFSAETIPNHVAMMTGVYPSRNGVPTNNYWDKDESPGTPTDEDLEKPKEILVPTIFTRIDDECRGGDGGNRGFRHGATLSKKYLFEIFKGDRAAGVPNDAGVRNVPPDTHWDPRDDPAYLPAPDEHTPDLPTMDQALVQLPESDLLFVNLGDVDRAAHAFGAAGRAGVLASADTQIARLVAALQDAGRWESTVLLIVSDHGMDFSPPGTATAISVSATLDQLASCVEPMFAVDNGGTNSIYVTNLEASAGARNESLKAARDCLLGEADCATICAGTTRPANADGIAFGWYVFSNPLDPANELPDELDSAHENLGDLVLSAAAGFKFTERLPGNPIPGNHGHTVTLHNTMIVAGGSPWVKRGLVVPPSKPAVTDFDRLPEQGENVDVAPTLAWLLGLSSQGFEGRVLTEAFVAFDDAAEAPSPTECGKLPRPEPSITPRVGFGG